MSLHDEGRKWLYAIGWIVGGVAMSALAAWVIWLVRYDWPQGTELRRLDILGNALYLLLAGCLTVMVGLAVRNAIRNLKASGRGVTLEANSHDDD